MRKRCSIFTGFATIVCKRRGTIAAAKSVRNSLCTLTAALFFFLALPLQAQLQPESIELAKTVPIADTHLHNYQGGAGNFKELLERNNVQWAGGVGYLNDSMESILKGRYIAAIGQREFDQILRQGRSFTDPDQWIFKSLFKEAEEGFKLGTIQGFGELHTDNYDSSPRPEYRRRFRLDSPMMRQAYELANRYGAFIQIHSGMDDTFKDDLLLLSADYPNVTTILSHCLPKARPDDLRNLFKQRKNIVCEVSGGGPVHASMSSRLGDGKFYTPNGLKPAWKALFEEFPTQVMLGSDTCCGLEARYDEIIREQREQLLAYLTPATLEQVAYKNAVRVFKLEMPQR
jgi:hypothetical protein